MSAQPAQFRLPFSHYAALGYRPIPTDGKVPVGGAGWNQRVYTLPEYEGLDATQYNVGLLCSNVVGIDIDVQHPKNAKAVERVVRKVLGLPKDAPRRVGAAPKALFICRTDAPMKGFDIAHTQDGKRSVLFQLLGDGKQFVIDGTHPDTHKPYTLNAPLPAWTKLPLLTPEKAEALRVAVMATLADIGYEVSATGATGKKGTGKFSGSPWTPTGMEQALDALATLNPDMTMNEWAMVGMALHDGTHGAQEGLDIWDGWSSGGEKYKGRRDCESRWRGFKPGGAITRASLFKNDWPKQAAGSPHEPPVRAEGVAIDDGGMGFDLRSLVDVRIDPIPWIIEDTAAPGAMLVVGRPKGGKSLLTADMVFAVGNGMPFLGKQSRRTGVLWIAAEDDRDQVARRIQSRARVQPVPQQVIVMTEDKLRDEATKWEEGTTLHGWLDVFLEAHPAIGLVIIDTQASAEAKWGGDSAGDTELRKSKNVVKAAYESARVYQDIGLARGVCIALVHHTRKRNGKDVTDYHELINMPQTVVAGVTSSIVVADLPDADPHEPSKRRVLAVRGRHAADRTDLIEMNEAFSFKLLGDFVDVQMTEKRTEILEAIEAMQRELDDPKGWLSLRSIAEDCAIKEGTLKVHFHRMRKVQGGTVWKGRTLEFKRGPGGGVRLA